MTTYEMAEMAADRSTLTTADMMAAIETFLTIIPQQLVKGNIVELGEFGSFWLRSTSEGADAADDVNPEQISTLLPRFNPGKRFRKVLKTIDYARGAIIRDTEPEQV